jgi:hypothetical protein
MKMKLCPHCGRLSVTVLYRPDWYARDVNNIVGAMWIACNYCATENAQDI